MTRKSVVEKRTKQLQQQFEVGTQTPTIDGYRLTYHAAIRMVARRIEIDWLRDALKAPGRHQPDGNFRHLGDLAMCIVDNNTIVTVGYGLLNNVKEEI